MSFKPVSPKVDFPKLEQKILGYWKRNKIFEKSIESRPKDKKWTFLDGPPFVTGVPHYGSLLSSMPKDLFGRYWTMKGYRVRRVWGWDGHGLPVENKVEEELGIKSKREIEGRVGVKKFIEECKKYVNQTSAEWEWYIDHIGRWVDFKNAYKTWNINYMESVMWVFKQMYDRGYIYKGLRVSLYCSHCATPISNFEVAMDADNYKDVSESATTYKYELEGEEGTYLLAWSTTPWNKIVTPALAVNPKLIYVEVRQGDELYILAKSTLENIIKDSYETVSEFKGSELIGKKFKPHYDYYKSQVKSREKLFEVIGGGFVTAEEGTGIVTIAAYGEDDLRVMKEQNVHVETHLDEEGTVKDNVPKFGRMYYLKANKAVNEDLASRGLIYKDEKYTHSVPHCWRCGTRLYYAPIDAWYVNVQTLKPLMKRTNEKINWFPGHFKHGRFLKSLESAPDWNISRNRYWGSPVPVWECGKCHERFIPGSIKELEEASGSKISDLHKPGIDEIIVNCKKCGSESLRTPEVLDSWIEAGSASFAERHFPFDQSQKLEDFFPPDFIAEYTGQIRAWFYVLHVIGAALYKSPAFKNVSVTGVILGSDGRKMSKNYGNYPDPKMMLDTYGGDALRMYLMSSPVMKGEDILISEEQYKMQIRGTLLILWNVYNFFVSYANIDGWSPASHKSQASSNALDRWVISLTNRLIIEVTEALDSYDTVSAITKIQDFVNNLSTWYIRRSRDRVGLSAENREDKELFYETTFETLSILSKLFAPIAPLISEEIFRNLTGEESVHLVDWPKPIYDLVDKDLEQRMTDGMAVTTIILARRKAARVAVRIPLRKLSYFGPRELTGEVLKIVLDEVNVYELNFEGKEKSYRAEGDMSVSNQDLAAGAARDIIRKIQAERKNLGTSLDEKVDVELPDWPKDFEEEIRKKALVDKLTKSEIFRVVKK
ncbi:MAG: isoleucine--tRNA ligase [Candidatus Levybacteria bacterium RIFCSPHIGHO2_02_FULL_40_18]|nr:MAG: isoleucine--tRNA ligase [Candidatus Levybacteria bacterium RIFCSPHIGHO2_01_FULL_40_58]OGH27126.1 MAG: isoleucine--tRNA ligase [Candidatus Levybacteria bacterium RIFCSPHIGHO2_02_FULL_40_18]OGH30985.1 MAG: isoleucine--tRNA ligase [Candidatus Levybacteria bacterium RIFCSPHIGHO2_12_FULL_40_31]OGH40996.1 MAG: isoleucine--tRNA ligase [Candidatus Levybacteria bacterium RIFCSPLOWO2_01_FULL_40_64]OGH48927.1 MAG: isoleucine--tRNA ligase [Candidatus Levybacteria bacterium RIFCSPLOWO2_02_FULL_41_11